MKIIIDILLFILFVLEFSKIHVSSFLHELIGILIVLVLFNHLLLNRNYIKTIFKGKYNSSRLSLLIVNILLFVGTVVTIVLGIMMSQSLFKSIGSYSLTISKMHLISSCLTIVILGIHIGFNANQMLAKVKFLKNEIVSLILQLVIVAYGFYSIIMTDFYIKIFGIRVFFVNEANLFVVMLRYTSIIVTIAIITSCIRKLIQKTHKDSEIRK